MSSLTRICAKEPSVPHQSGNSIEIRGTSGVLLRILLLSRDPKVPIVGASEVMGIKPSGFGQYLTQLRQLLQDEDLIKRENGMVSYTGDRELVDSTIVKSIYDRVYEKCIDLDELTKDVAEQVISDLEEIENVYDGNPAIGLSGFQMENISEQWHNWALDLDGVFSDWIELWGYTQLWLADCRMILSPTKRTGRKVLADLLKIANTPDPDEDVFPRLLRAAQMSQDASRHRNAWDLAQDFYAREQLQVPDEIRGFSPSIAAMPVNKLRVSRPLLTSSHSDANDHILEMARLLGITSDSTLALQGAEIEPTECLARTTRRLYFSGILASKWVVDARIRSEFEQLLNRLDEQEEGGDVRFMIIDPEGDAYSELFQLRGGRLSKESIPHLRNLASRFHSLEVRVVNSLPAFRIVVIDDDVVSFSPYALEEERYATSKGGWDAPHVILDPLAQYPLANAFRLYFEERWLGAIPL